MVWGMALPSGLGDFFPDGSYVGWREYLNAYFLEKMASEQKARFSDGSASTYRRYVSEKFINEPGSKRSPDVPAFGPIEGHEAPKRFETEKSYSSLGSLVMLNDRILAVDASLKDIIERYEAGKHHFFPIEIVMPKKVIYPNSYFVMAIGQYLDSFSPQQSDPASWNQQSLGYCSFVESKKSMSGLALSSNKFGGAHLWRERRMSNPLICFSDYLMSEIENLGQRLPKHYQMRAV